MTDREERDDSNRTATSKTAELDPTLDAIGFEIDVVSGDLVSGRFIVTEACCQPFKVLHGGISALIAEALGSMGAHVASGFRRIAGIQLSVNHLRSAQLGDHLAAEARPIHVGKTIQVSEVWEARLWKIHPSTSEKGVLIASSRLTCLSNMPVPENAKEADENLRKYAKL